MILELTDPEGRTLWIVERWITKIARPTKGEWATEARALIWMGANVQAVQEEPETIVKMILAEETEEGA